MKDISFLRKENFALCTRKLIFTCLFLSIGTLIFGYGKCQRLVAGGGLNVD